MVNRKAERKLRVGGTCTFVLVGHAWATFDLVVFKVILWLFGALASKLTNSKTAGQQQK